MISLPFRRLRRPTDTIAALYGVIVAQARRPAFYQSYGVPDTVEGRLDMIVLHLVLLLRALKATPSDHGFDAQTGQKLFDHFCGDIDGNLREMGIGDLAVPKHMKRVAEAFYGRAKVYDGALDGDDAEALETSVARNVFGQAEPVLGAQRLAAYMREASRKLAATPAAELMRGELAFPDPETTITSP